MASDPFFPNGPPTTLLGALTAGLAIAGLVIRTLWQRLTEKDKRIAELQDARVEDQKEHNARSLEMSRTLDKATAAMNAAIGAITKRQPPSNGSSNPK